MPALAVGHVEIRWFEALKSAIIIRFELCLEGGLNGSNGSYQGNQR